MRNLGDVVGDFMRCIIDNAMSDIQDEMDHYVFVKPGYARVKPMREKRIIENPKRVAEVMSALGNEHRLRILEELSRGGLYANDFHELLPEISPSTLSSHLDVLQKAGLVAQKSKGRYLITMPALIASRMAN